MGQGGNFEIFPGHFPFGGTGLGISLFLAGKGGASWVGLLRGPAFAHSAFAAGPVGSLTRDR